jgi:hypothetical protein
VIGALGAELARCDLMQFPVQRIRQPVQGDGVSRSQPVDER